MPRAMTVLVAALLWLAQPVPGQAAEAPVRLVADENPPPAPPPETNPFSGDHGIIAEGRSSFNVHCSHCHAPNAENPDPRTDLRRLRLRYGQAMTRVFYVTVTEGRPAKGMPPWKAALGEETLWKILTFLESVQKAP